LLISGVPVRYIQTCKKNSEKLKGSAKETYWLKV